MDSVSDDQITGTAKLSLFPWDSGMFYFSYSTGYKSGGTNTERISPAFNPIFGPETSTSIEAGFKGFLGPLRVSLSIFDTDYEDFQAQAFTGTGFNLQNAGEIETQGVEVEVLWRPFDSFEVQGYYARNEGDYKSFLNGTCRDTAVFHTGVADPGGAMTKDFAVGNNNLFIRGEYTYMSEQYTDGDLDPFTLQDDVGLINLRAGMYITDWDTDITIWGRNISDEKYYAGSFDAPIQSGRMNSYPGEPATYGITVRKNFE